MVHRERPPDAKVDDDYKEEDGAVKKEYLIENIIIVRSLLAT